MNQGSNIPVPEINCESTDKMDVLGPARQDKQGKLIGSSTPLEPRLIADLGAPTWRRCGELPGGGGGGRSGVEERSE
jgi:hypothetical protein